MALQRTLLYGLLAVLVLAPLPFGSVEPWSSALLAASCLALGALWILWRARRGLPVLPWKDPVLAAGALFALVGVVQLIPLPRQVLEALSPKAVELRDRYEPRAAIAGAVGLEREDGTGPTTAPEQVTSPEPFVDGASRFAFEGWRPISLYPWATRRAILRFLAFLVAALAVFDLAAHGPARRALVTALVASGAFQAIYGLAEYFSGRQHIFAYAKKYYTDVATGTFINRNHYAGYLELTLPLAIALAGVAVTRARRASVTIPSRGPGAGGSLTPAAPPGRELFNAGALLVLCLTMATALICSRSRMGIASALVGLLSVGLLLAWRRRGKGFVTAAVIVAGATGLVFSQGEAATAIIDRFLVSVGELRGNLGRWQIWSQAAGMARSFPLIGAGLGAFPFVFPAFRSGGEGVGLEHAHNDYLELAAEVGATGCLVGLLAAGLVARSLRRRPLAADDHGLVGYAATAGLVAIALHSLTDFNLAIPGNSMTLAAVLGLSLACARTKYPVVATPPVPVERRRGARAWLGAGALTAGAFAALTVTFGGGADRQFREASLVAAPAMSDLVALAQARGEGPTEATEEAGRYIARRLDKAVALQVGGLGEWPVSSRGHIGLAKLRIGQCAAASLAGAEPEGCMARAMQEFRAALDLSPMSASAHAEVARVLLAAWPILDDDTRTAAEPIVERAGRMNPSDRDLRGATLAMRSAEALR
jgi:O-antigen ligase